MKNIALWLSVVFFVSFTQADGWMREDLYQKGRHAIDEDCFLAIQMLSAFQEINRIKLATVLDFKASINASIQACKASILAQRKVEYVFLPTQQNTACDQEGDASGQALTAESTATIKYRIVKKSGNPHGMESPYHVYFELETPNSTLSYPLLPAVTKGGEFLPYKGLLDDATLKQAAPLSEHIFQQYLDKQPAMPAYSISPQAIEAWKKNPVRIQTAPAG